MQLTATLEIGKPTGTFREFRQHAHAGSRISGFFADVVYSLVGMECASRLPILQQHDHTKIVALATEARMAPDGLHLAGQMYATDAAKEVQQLADAGFPWQASVGVRTLEAEWVDEGKELTVNGRLEKGPFIHIAKSRVYESSFVPIGADNQTSSVVLSDNGGADSVDVRGAPAPIAPGGAKEETMSNSTVPAPAADPNAGVLLERKRAQELKAAFPKDPSFALKHIEAGSSVLEARAAYADELQKRLDDQAAAAAKGDRLPPLGTLGSGGQPASALEEWNGKLAVLLADIPAPTAAQRWAAVKRLQKAEPKLHEAYLEEYNLTKPARARKA